jgi:hypothetical protein
MEWLCHAVRATAPTAECRACGVNPQRPDAHSLGRRNAIHFTPRLFCERLFTKVTDRITLKGIL